MKKTLAVLLLLVLAVGLFSCSQKEEIPSGYQIASIESDPFTLYVPNSWTSNASSGISSAYYASTGRVMVSAFFDKKTDDTTLPLYTARVLSSFQSKLTDFEMIDQLAGTTLGSYAAYYMDYTAKTGDVDMQFRTYISDCDGGFTVLTFSADPANYLLRKTDFDQIVANFTFKVENTETEGTAPVVENDPIDGWQLCSGSKYEFKFYVPTSWTVDKASEVPTAVWSTNKDDFSNVTMMSYVLTDGSMTSAQYWDKTKAELPYDYEVIATDDTVKLGGIPAFGVEYKTGLVDMNYHVKQVFCATANMVYVFTYTSDNTHYDSHMNSVNEMISMFEFR